MIQKDIFFHYEETDFRIEAELRYRDFLSKIITSEDHQQGSVNIIFCTDDYLLHINKEYLKHDYYTDIITFDYTENKIVSADVYISIERVKENAQEQHETFENELRRVLAHGILHCCGYADKTESQKLQMAQKEDEKIKLFHVEH